MLALIQRVKNANVKIDTETYAEISQGILILCGFEKNDTIDCAFSLLNKCINYRIFADHNDKMNLSLSDIKGEALIVPQFTLVANTKSGLRPSFSKGMPPKEGAKLFDELKNKSHELYNQLSFGCFGADMQVSLCNDGPVTFLLSTN